MPRFASLGAHRRVPIFPIYVCTCSVLFKLLSWIYRATARVEKPIGVFPIEEVALGELLAPGHLAEADTEGQRGFIKLPLKAGRQGELGPKPGSQPPCRASTSSGSFQFCRRTWICKGGNALIGPWPTPLTQYQFLFCFFRRSPSSSWFHFGHNTFVHFQRGQCVPNTQINCRNQGKFQV